LSVLSLPLLDGDPNTEHATYLVDLGAKLHNCFQESTYMSEDWRMWGREAIDFYDGRQWDEDERQRLKAGNRPVLTINQISKAIDNILGREAASRFSWKLLPREARDVVAADEMTRGLAYVADQVHVELAVSDGFASAVKGPMGIVEVAYEDRDPSKEPIVVREVNVEDFFYDPYSRRYDFSDARYVGRRKVVDLDVALANWPWAQDVLMMKSFTGEKALHERTLITDDYNNRARNTNSPLTPGYVGMMGVSQATRMRVELTEIWWKEQESADVYMLPNGTIWEWNPEDPRILQALAMRVGQRFIGVKDCFYYSVMCDQFILHADKSPYKHNKYPFVPFWCKRDRVGRPYGMIEAMKDPQRELNTARSRFNESIRSRWLIYAKGQLSPQELAEGREMIQRPNFMWGVTNPNAVQMGNDKPDGEFWANLMETSRAEIDDVIGQNEVAYGDKSNERSGEAIKQRVLQQGQNHGRLWDNLRNARRMIGEMVLSLMIEFYPTQKLQRILGVSALAQQATADLTWLNPSDPYYQTPAWLRRHPG
jgi:hypothetical protein